VQRRLLALNDAASETASLWRALKKSGCLDARERLILHHFPLVKFVAGRVGAGLPASVEFDDLVSYGAIGLIEAVDRFDLKRNVKFETYAVSRIRGAILDEMRALDWVPRSVRAKNRQLERAKSKLRADLLREPTRHELASEVGWTEHELSASRMGSTMSLVALEELVTHGGAEDGESVTVLDRIVDDTIEDPGADVELSEMKRALLRAITALTDREQAMISLYYFEDQTLSCIGVAFGVSESRISQIRAKALRALGRSERVRACFEGYCPSAEEPDEPTVRRLHDERISVRSARRIA